MNALELLKECHQVILENTPYWNGDLLDRIEACIEYAQRSQTSDAAKVLWGEPNQLPDGRIFRVGTSTGTNASPPFSAARVTVSKENPICTHGRNEMEDDCGMCERAGVSYAHTKDGRNAIAQRPAEAAQRTSKLSVGVESEGIGSTGILCRDVSALKGKIVKGSKVVITAIGERGYSVKCLESGMHITECGYDIFDTNQHTPQQGVVVPLEPTEEMLCAAWDVCSVANEANINAGPTIHELRIAYKAMLAAAKEQK